ncbi:MAG: sortase [Candidatus Sungbacteria bacterium]|uniref:Sortase n=1 Tax=Candidatus Sungiibacteriota bacterium TaxID=2750080 RepID=A0A9D6LRW6_9BACT|nr:sortase [Candidatus Sungbacteria bacterium]
MDSIPLPVPASFGILKTRVPAVGGGKFLAISATNFMLAFMLLYLAGLMPDGAKEIAGAITHPFILQSRAETTPLSETESPAVGEDSNWRIEIQKINVDAPILLPDTRAPVILNEDLTQGVVHYPGSAMPGEIGNVFLFGHSTGLAFVHNKNYEIFNDVKKLGADDVIKLENSGRVYLYLVKSVENKKAGAAEIQLTSDKKLLTLSTCNIFGGEEARYIVEAEFLRSYPVVVD